MDSLKLYVPQPAVTQAATPAPLAVQNGVLEHPRYYARQLMTPDDLTLEHNYLRDKMRRHNRLLHGWGVVCGAIVCRVVRAKTSYPANQTGLRCAVPTDTTGLDPWIVCISPGYILGPCGDEILIDTEVMMDVRNSCTTVTTGEGCAAPDPWCGDVVVNRKPSSIYLAVKYHEMPVRPVRVSASGCGCGDACEFSRYRDGFDICPIDQCPETHLRPPRFPPECTLEACLPCPTDPWVVLARIDINAEGITKVDNHSCRRMVISFANQWCLPDQQVVYETASQPDLERQRELERKRAEAHDQIAQYLSAAIPPASDPDMGHKVMSSPALQIVGVKDSSPLGKMLENAHLTIEQVVDRGKEDFLAMATAPISEANQKRRVRTQASDLWDRAKKIQAIVISLGAEE